MKIRIRSEEAKFTLPIPTGLVLNPLAAMFLPQVLEQAGIHVTKQQTLRLMSAINQYRRGHKEWALVEVRTASGEEVLIKL